jgi:hypothetical protein
MDTNELRRHAHQTPDSKWWFSSPKYTHDEESAKAIVKLCQLLEVPITDIVTTSMLTKLAQRVIDLENKLEYARLYGFSISAEDE